MKPAAYNRTAIALHWLMAGLILAALPLGLTMTELALSPTKLKLYAWHKWLGVTLFGLALVRVFWRLTHPAPALPATIPAWQQTAAHVLHGLLYVLMLAIPLSGWLMSSAKGFQTVYLGLLPIPDLLVKDAALAETLAALHTTLNYGLIVLLLAHVGAALKHQWLERDAVLGRMLPWLNKAREAP
ncbi:cytochrome b561 [Sulfuritortus calidifontis]|uniref:Cytochrome b561 n=1 Tax=Sulfuritortus calidifontis TaxID=1914471 RepID=A0A4V2UR19_9PROT|nr:cytochrome b [Sulfuritortus calidifontis]TCS74077.1 cytochrome b561 [Sulfuritortus calidifontis]